MKDSLISYFNRHHHLFTGFLLLAGLSALFMFLNWNAFNMPFERDEGEYAYSAWLLKQGIAPYANSFLQKPPMIIYTYLAALFIHTDALWPPRFLAFIFVMATSLLIGLIVRKEYDAKTAYTAMFLFIPMMSLYFLSAPAANTEKFMLLPLTGVLALYVYHKKSDNPWPWFLAGFCSALAVFYKQIAVVPVCLVFLFWFLSIRRENKNFTLLIRLFLYAFTGALAGALLCLSYFLINGNAGYIWEEAFLFNKYYAERSVTDLSFWWFYHKSIFINCWILYLLFFWCIFFNFRKSRPYLVLFVLSALSIFSARMNHYYLLLMPFWAIICAVALNDMALKISNTLKIKNSYAACLLTIIALIVIIFPLRHQIGKTPEELNLLVYGNIEPFIEAQTAGKKLAEITNPDDTVFVAGSEPEILFYARRRSATRFTITYPLNILTPKRVVYQQEAMKDLSASLPVAIVLSRKETSGLWYPGSPTTFINFLLTLINEKYTLVEGYVSENGHSGSWRRLANQSEIEKSTLLLFKRTH